MSDGQGLTLTHAPIAPFMERHTAHPPGMVPTALSEWLHRDETFAAQMAYRDRLCAERRDVVFRQLAEGEAAAAELLDLVTANVCAHHGAVLSGRRLTRADGVAVDLEADAPLLTAGRLAQEDFLILQKEQKDDPEHVLTGGILCFPASWSLVEKMGLPLTGIHRPVTFYAGDLARRVQRLFNGVRTDRALIRANWLFYGHDEFHLPGKTGHRFAEDRLFLRVERQGLVRLPRTGAVVFSVRTLITPAECLSPGQARGALRAIGELSAVERDYKVRGEVMEVLTRLAA